VDSSSYRLGCDIGGTFTDFVLVDGKTGAFETHKCLTTPGDPSEAVETGIRALLEKRPGFMEGLEEIIHGTTLVINAIIERKGATTGLLTTQGFRDVLELCREIRYDAYDIFAEYPEPLIPRPLRKEIEERIAADGRVLTPLNKTAVRKALVELKRAGAESIAVCFLHSYENPEHERAVKEIVEKEFPGFFLSLSSEVLPQIREYERTSTTATNAYVKPVTGRYVERLSGRLDALGFSGTLFIMLSSGGITTPETARTFPVRIIESGPTAAVIASRHFGRLFDLPDVFCFDMGGTTAKSCLIRKGEAGLVSTFEVGRVRRFKRGSGLPVQVPVVDLMEIGAGGGSIARINRMGLLQVGPESAGADPGPVCYHRGGRHPTVTDADLALGYLDPDYFLGGAMPLNREAAESAIRAHIAEPLGVSPENAAFGIHDLINETMAAAAKTHIAEKGGNPSQITVTAFGGAGPVHAYGLAKKIGASKILVPPLAGVGSALGFFTAPVAFDLSRSRRVTLENADLADIEALFQSLEAQGEAVLKKAAGEVPLIYERTLSMRFVGQGSETDISIEKKDFSQWSRGELRKRFDDAYRALYGRTYPDTPVEFITFRVRVRLPDRPFIMPAPPAARDSPADARKPDRKAYSLLSRAFVPFAVYARERLSPGRKIPGPAIIEEAASTIVVGEDGAAEIDDRGFVWITLKRTL
jgi:N-methylhydantoinase A